MRSNRHLYTYIPTHTPRICRVVPLILFLLASLFLSSCEFWQQPVRDYFEKWTNEIAIDKFQIEGVESYYDKDGNLCIPSGQDVPVTLFMRNPYHYVLGTSTPDSTLQSQYGYEQESPYITELDPGDNHLITQDTADTTVLHFTYPLTYLETKDGGGVIGKTIQIKHPYNGNTKDFTFALKCNSKPPVISSGAVMLNNNKYYLCFNIPVTDIHKDLKKVIISNGSSSESIEFEVNSSKIIQLSNPSNLGTSGPEGGVVPVADGPTFTPEPGSHNNFYYNSGIQAQNGVEQSFTITLVDEAGLSSSTDISTASKQVKTPTVKDLVANSAITSSSTTTLELNTDYNAQIKINNLNETTNGEPVGDVAIHYTLKKVGSAEDPEEETTLTRTIENTGTYTLTVWATASGYLDSDKKTYTIKVPPLKVHFYANGGTLLLQTQDIDKNVPRNLTAASSVVEKTGYDCIGWAASPTGPKVYDDGAQVQLTSDKNLYALWQPKTFTVTFNKNGGDSCPVTSRTVTYDQAYGYGDAQHPWPDGNNKPVKKGYKFLGWHTAGRVKRESTDTVAITDHTTLYALWEREYYTYTYSVNHSTFKGITATPDPTDERKASILEGKIAYGSNVNVQFEGSTGYGMSSVTVKEIGGNRTVTGVTVKENGGTKVTINFTMPDYPIDITPTFNKAFKVKIEPYNCNYNGINGYVKTKCKNKVVRIWIASTEGAFDSECKEVTLDENAEYDGYVLYPEGRNSLTNAKVCALTRYTIDEYVNHGFGFASVSSGSANITMYGLMIGVVVNGGNKTSKLISEVRDYNQIDPLPENLGFKYIWKNQLQDEDEHWYVYYQSSPTANNAFTWTSSTLINGENTISGAVSVAGIQADSNYGRPMDYP